MLDIELERQGPPPIDAATILCLRDGAEGLEVLCVERHPRSGFLGGAIVFPGGKLDPSDRDPRNTVGASLPTRPSSPIADDDATLVALAVAAARECFEEAGLLFHRRLESPLEEPIRRAIRARLAAKASFPELLAEHGIALDLRGLVPFARWVTPVSETRRFDTRFYLARAPEGQTAIHDAHETTSAFWAPPSVVLARFARGEYAIYPPTHRSLEVLEGASTVDGALVLASSLSLGIICPELVKHVGADAPEGTLALVLPGDPDHSLREVRVPGASRYVLRDKGQWLPWSARR